MWGKEWARPHAAWLRIMSLACPALAERIERGRRVYLLGANAAAPSASGPESSPKPAATRVSSTPESTNVLRARVTVA
jgi:hypothetical protein